MNGFKKALLVSALMAISIFVTNAQSPEPVIIPAASAAASPAAGTQGPAPLSLNSEDFQTAIQILEQMKAANGEILKKQEATLQQLDELQKAAEQLKIFTKRG